MKEASIISRLLAFLIDYFVLLCSWCMVLGMSMVGYKAGGDEISIASLDWILLIFLLFCLSIFLFYFVYLTMGESSTIGKKLMGITVVTNSGSVLSFFRSFIRCLSFVLFLPLWFISLIIALCFKGKTLHDIVSGTRVIKEGL